MQGTRVSNSGEATDHQRAVSPRQPVWVVLGLAVVLFLLAAAPRLWRLDYFLMVDENLWYQRSANFLQALTSGRLAETVQTGHPGVTTMWSGTLGLLLAYGRDALSQETLAQFAQRMAHTPATLAMLYWLRLPLALLSALMAAVAFLLARRLIGQWAALSGAALMAFEPLFVAHSRSLHHDAPATDFSLLAVLCWLLFLKDRRRIYLGLAGLGIALATLSKVSSVFLLAFAGLTLLPRLWPEGRFNLSGWKRVLFPWLQLLLVVLVVAVLAWPALWVSPVATLQTVVGFINQEKGAHANGTFFMGRPVDDAGPLYYPVSLAFALTPLTVIGLLLALAALAVWYLRRQPDSLFAGGAERNRWVSWLLAYALLFLIFMSLIGKKQERYVLPAVVVLDLVAGWGWLVTFRWLFSSLWHRTGSSFWVTTAGSVGVPLLLLLGQLAFALPTAPYYATFFSPLFGGAKKAEDVILIGRGEGLDQAVRYVQSASGGDLNRVASWYGTTVAVLFGDQVEVSDTAHPQYVLASDYVILYINQLQRGLLKESIWRYLDRQPAADTVRLSGIDYAYVYRGKAIGYPVDPYADYNRLVGKANLIGFDVQAELVAGASTPVRLYWMNDGMAAGDRLYVTLLDGAGNRWGEGECAPDPAFGGVDSWQDEEIIESTCHLDTFVGTPPGDYLLRVGLTAEDGTEIGLMYPTPEEATLSVAAPTSFPDDESVPVGQYVGAWLGPQAGLELVGYDYNSAVYLPGGSLPVTFYWRAGPNPGANYEIAVTLKGGGAGQYAEWVAEPLEGRYPTSQWRPGELVRDPRTLVLPTSLPTGDYRLQVILLDEDRNPLDRRNLTTVTVEGREHTFLLTQPPDVTQVADVGHFAYLIGYDLSGAVDGVHLLPGETLQVRLVWQAKETPEDNYVVFVQLLDQSNQVVAQHDGQPGGGELITTTWAPGEYISDVHPLALPADLPAGDYRLIVGMYLPDTGERLTTYDVHGDPTGDYLTLGEKLRLP